MNVFFYSKLIYKLFRVLTRNAETHQILDSPSTQLFGRLQVYCYKTLPAVASRAVQSPAEHSHYGTPELLQKYAEEPHLMKPSS